MNVIYAWFVCDLCMWPLCISETSAYMSAMWGMGRWDSCWGMLEASTLTEASRAVWSPTTDLLWMASEFHRFGILKLGRMWALPGSSSPTFCQDLGSVFILSNFLISRWDSTYFQDFFSISSGSFGNWWSVSGCLRFLLLLRHCLFISLPLVSDFIYLLLFS